MKSAIKQQWLAALRSGKYQQCHGVLRKQTNRFPDEKATGMGYCCLGVLCDVAGPALGGCWISEGGSWYERAETEEADCDHVGLPIFVRNGVGLSEGSPRIKLPKDHPIRLRYPKVPEDIRGIELASLNDAGASFSEIADLIEQFIPAE